MVKLSVFAFSLMRAMGGGAEPNDLATFRYWHHRDAEAGTTRALFPIRVDGREGFMNREGEVVIEPQFDKVYPFQEGLAAATVGGKWGYIDEQGKQVIAPTFATAGLFREGRAAVRMKPTDPYGYIDTSGTMVIPARYDAASDFVDGVARVGIETTVSKIKGRFADVGLDCSYHYIDHGGNTVLKPVMSNPPKEKLHRLTPIKVNGKMGFADADGKVVIEARFDYVDYFENGLALFTVDGGQRSGYIDERGNVVWQASK